MNITVKQYEQLKKIQERASVAQLAGQLSLLRYRFVRLAIRGLYATQQEFETRADVQEYINTLGDLLEEEIQKEKP